MELTYPWIESAISPQAKVTLPLSVFLTALNKIDRAFEEFTFRMASIELMHETAILPAIGLLQEEVDFTACGKLERDGRDEAAFLRVCQRHIVTAKITPKEHVRAE